MSFTPEVLLVLFAVVFAFWVGFFSGWSAHVRQTIADQMLDKPFQCGDSANDYKSKK